MNVAASPGKSSGNASQANFFVMILHKKIGHGQ